MERIVVATDFSEQSREALKYGVAFAERTGARLYVLHVLNQVESDDEFSPIRLTPEAAAGSPSTRPDDLIRGWLEEEIDRLDDNSVHIEPVRRHGTNISRTILQFLRRQKADLLVVGTHGRSGFQSLLIGSVARRLVRAAPCPTLTIRSPFADSEDKNILVPVDLSEHSDRLVAEAGRLASLWGAELHLLHVVPPMAFPLSLTGVRTIYDVVPDINDRARQLLTGLVESHVPSDVTAVTHVESGTPGKKIVELARLLDTWMILMATHGLGAVDRFFLGSVTERVIQAASRPVLSTHTGVLDEEAELEDYGRLEPLF